MSSLGYWVSKGLAERIESGGKHPDSDAANITENLHPEEAAFLLLNLISNFKLRIAFSSNEISEIFEEHTGQITGKKNIQNNVRVWQILCRGNRTVNANSN